jgi:hypothetical protein
MAQLAEIRKRLQVGAEDDFVEGEDGETYSVTTPVYAEIGDVVDVSDWAHLQAYVSNGSINLIPQSMGTTKNSEQDKPKQKGKGTNG